MGVGGGGGAFAANLPAGLTLYRDITMDRLAAAANATSVDGMWYGGSITKVSDATVPDGSGVAMQIPYPGNDAGNGINEQAFGGPENQGWKKFYFAQWVWFSSNYSTHTNEEKYFYPIITSPGNANEGYGNIDFNLVGSQTANGPQHGFKWFAQQSSSTQGLITKGQWCKVEMYGVISTVGNADGILKIWVDNVVALDSSTIRYSLEDTQASFDGIKFSSVRGGGASSVLTPAGGQYRRYGRLAFYASTSF